MKFTKIRLNGLSTVDLPIVNALPTDIYILKAADGLGPPEVDVSIANTLNAGGFYQGRRPQPREIVLRIGLNPNYRASQTVADLRASLYGMLTPGVSDIVQVDIMDGDTQLVYTTGYVKKLEIAPFSPTPEVQLVLACMQQYLLSPTLLYVNPGSEASPVISNVGNAPAGFEMEVIFTAATTNWALVDANGVGMGFAHAFASGDKLIFNTQPGSRGAWLVANGTSTKTNFIHKVTYDSTWYMLHGGDNIFATSSQNFNWGNVSYLPQYWGI
jgi:hypothetical protein